MRRGRHSAETGSHPFRSMFDLMLALVLLLLAAFALRQPHARADYDMTRRRNELLMLHNLQIRQKPGGEHARVYDSVNQLPPDDDLPLANVCRLVKNNDGPVTEEFKQMLEQHRSKMWDDLGSYVQDRLLNPQIRRTIGEKELHFNTGAEEPINKSQGEAIAKDICSKCYDDKKKVIVFNRIRVEGHTDSDTVHTYKFDSNWELSAARACWLAKQIKIELNKRGVFIGSGRGHVLIEAIGYADSVPAQGNDKAQNRRIEIVYEDL